MWKCRACWPERLEAAKEWGATSEGRGEEATETETSGGDGISIVSEERRARRGEERMGGGKERRTLEDPPRHAAHDCDLDSHPHGFTILPSITPETGFSKSIPLIPSLAYSILSITLIYILNPTIYYLKFYYLNTNLIIYHLTNIRLLKFGYIIKKLN